jgi:hypothetical protein
MMQNDIYILHELRRKRTCSIVWKILFIICIILTKWSLAHFAELGVVNISVQYKNVFKKWKKERDIPAMIKRPKVKISELVMQRQNPTDTRVEGSKKH